MTHTMKTFGQLLTIYNHADSKKLEWMEIKGETHFSDPLWQEAVEQMNKWDMVAKQAAKLMAS